MPLPDDVPGLKAAAKGGSRAALIELAVRGIYPKRLWKPKRRGHNMRVRGY